MMDIKKILVMGLVLSAIGSAGIVGNAPGLAFSDNPVVPAIEKEARKIDAGFTLMSLTTQTPLGDDDTKGEKEYSEGLGGAHVGYTDQLGDFWYNVNLSNGTGLIEGFSFKSSLNDSVKGKTLEENQDLKLSFDLARDFAEFGGFTGGVNLTINQDKLKKIGIASAPGIKKIETIGGTESDAYLTFALGLAKDIDANSKVVFGQTLATEKTVKNLETTADGKKIADGGSGANDFVPAETAISYIYKVSDALEVAGTWAYNWGGEFDQQEFDKDGDDVGAYVTTEYKPYDTIGLAASYLFSEFEFVGYANFERDANIVVYDDYIADNDDNSFYGTDTSTFGLNVEWTPTFADIGAFGLNIENMRQVQGMYTFDNTTTSLSYKFLF